MKRIIPALLFILLGVLVAVTPEYIFPVCGSKMHAVSNCYWTARAELGTGLVLALGGLFMLLSASPLVRRGLALMCMLVSLLVVALPTILIGVCATETMRCVIGTLPALVVLGGLTFCLSLITALINKDNG